MGFDETTQEEGEPAAARARAAEKAATAGERQQRTDDRCEQYGDFAGGSRARAVKAAQVAVCHVHVNSSCVLSFLYTNNNSNIHTIH